ncbi:uncharacterized protein TNIN_322161 [Trichonephila inaurata madagascariensis]|uniref:Uncharacterized protein n=1 Tax=Trichonephila inaurata madagascariensis TaxID=2747483 RepID=A0A8X6XMJ7_9ARAC|nr:uncharacterized protein TNIN_322161 [Trichonephila inaurata madagascariensis]
MEKDLKLKEFSGELFSYIYREYNSAFELPVKLPHVFNHHAAGDFSEDEGKAVMKLCVNLRTVFSGAFTRAFPQVQRSVKHFMTFLTSRCLKLCGDDLFLSFLMICAFIAELNLFCWINGCFAFMNTAPKCLTAIFNRRLKKEFYASGGWERLRIFCESFVRVNGNGAEASELPMEYTPDDFINQDLLTSIEELLDQNSSSEDDSSIESNATSGSDDDEEDESNDEETGGEEASPVEQQQEMDDDEESEESSMDSDESDDSESEESAVKKKDKLNHTAQEGDSDDESDSSEESDPSSMSDDEESESEDSESDTAPNVEQINCIKPVMQENLSVEKKIL